MENEFICVFPDGKYNGLWSGWFATVVYEGETYSLRTPVGVRGINCPCIIEVKDGFYTITTTK